MKPAIIEAREEVARLFKRKGMIAHAAEVMIGLFDDKPEVQQALDDIIRDRAEYEKDKQS